MSGRLKVISVSTTVHLFSKEKSCSSPVTLKTGTIHWLESQTHSPPSPRWCYGFLAPAICQLVILCYTWCIVQGVPSRRINGHPSRVWLARPGPVLHASPYSLPLTLHISRSYSFLYCLSSVTLFPFFLSICIYFTLLTPVFPLSFLFLHFPVLFTLISHFSLPFYLLLMSANI
jgi:hypothetical protein